MVMWRAVALGCGGALAGGGEVAAAATKLP